MSDKPLLGELLVQQNLVSQNIIDTALRVQIGGNRRIGHILVRMKVITADQLAETLSKQLNIPITAVDDKFTNDVRRILPRYLCRKFDVIPLALKPNNILEVAMANPSDEEVISNLELFTGKVIKPSLALWSNIDKEIGRKIPLTIKDILTPQTNIWATRIAAIAALALVIGLSSFTLDYIQKTRYGTISTTDSRVLFTNHDLMIGVEKNGKISLLGHAAFASGSFEVAFDNTTILKSFIENRGKDFSEKQRTWLKWAMKQTETHAQNRTIASLK